MTNWTFEDEQKLEDTLEILRQLLTKKSMANSPTYYSKIEAVE